MSFPLNISCFWVNSTEKQPIASPAKTATGKKKKHNRSWKIFSDKTEKEECGKLPAINFFNRKQTLPTHSVPISGAENVLKPGTSRLWSALGSARRRQPEGKAAAPQPCHSWQKGNKYITNQWACLGSLAGFSVPRWFRAGALRRAKQRGQTKEVGPEDLCGGVLPTQIISGPEMVTFNFCLLIYLSYT